MEMMRRFSKHQLTANVFSVISSYFGTCFPSHVVVNDSIRAWRQLGFTVHECGCLRLNEMTIKLNSEVQEGCKRGVSGWAFSGLLPDIDSIDGIPIDGSVSCDCNRAGKSDESVDHENGVFEIDHIVIKTCNWKELDNTFRRIGIANKRSRVDEKTGTRYMFYRPSKTILEVIDRNDGSIPVAAKIWGITFSCRDIDATHNFLSDVTKTPWQAVQPGRRITTLQSGKRDVSIALAFMSPHVKL